MSDARMTKDLFSRPRCSLLGCVQEEDLPCCHYCHTHLYDDYIQYGLLDPVFRLSARLTRKS